MANTKERAEKKEEKLAEMLAQAESHPMMKGIMAERAAEVLAKRQEAAGKIEALRKDRDEVIPKLQADLKTKETKYLKVKAALDAAQNELQTAKAALWREDHLFNHAIGKCEAVLFETADPRIDEAIEHFRNTLDELRKPGKISRDNRGSELNIYTMSKVVTTETNVGAIHSALAYCQAAIKELEKMKLCPAVDLEKITELKSRIPSIDVYQEFTGEKPMFTT
jgi:Skp family chaperone for outer membrane proteins